MECPHCRIAFHAQWFSADILTYSGSHWRQYSWSGTATVCPSCKEAIIDLRQLQGHQQIQRIRAYPRDTIRRPAPAEVPAAIKEDYDEACIVLPVSPKAAAALARRCLQAVLREKGYLKRDLAQQIDDLLNEQDLTKAIPTALRDTVDAVRNFGNFSAHPVTDQTTLQVIPVESGEAEWCLDILEEMFDNY